MFVNVIVICVVLLLLTLIYYMKKTNELCKSTKKLDGKTTLVTGGTSGIGLEIALDFASRGARVIIACPFKDEGLRAEKLIVEKTGNRNVIFKLLDLASLKSVRSFASDILKSEDRLDVLVNNAGVGIEGDYATADGMSFIMQVNYYGHFLLTILLLPLLIKTGKPNDNSRIVNTTSLTRYIASFDVENYDKVGYWLRLRIYANSKLSLVLFSRELTKRIGEYNVVMNSADPGIVGTRIYDSATAIVGLLVRFLCKFFFRNPFEGAQTAIHLSVDDKAGLVSGQVFYNCEMNKKLHKDFDVAAEKLWDRSINLVKLENYELKKIFNE